MLTNESCRVEDMYNLSTYCLTAEHPGGVCAPAIDSSLRRIAGIWCIVNAIIGFSGNLLTLLAIPYASRHKRFENRKFVSIFIIHHPQSLSDEVNHLFAIGQTFETLKTGIFLHIKKTFRSKNSIIIFNISILLPLSEKNNNLICFAILIILFKKPLRARI